MSASPEELSPSPVEEREESPASSSNKRPREEEEEEEDARKKKVAKTITQYKTLVIRAGMRAIAGTTVQHGGTVISDLPIALFNALWVIMKDYVDTLYPGLKYPAPSFSRALKFMWPGVSFKVRYGLYKEVEEALKAATQKTGIEFDPSAARVNLRLFTEDEMRRTSSGSPGYELLHLLFKGDKQHYQGLVTRWWQFLTPYFESLEAR
jgi:hypothetical protein